MMHLISLVVTGLCALALSACLTGAALAYARRRGLFDQPGQRRSHSMPTPRGGGVGVVASMLLIGVPAWCLIHPVEWWFQPAAFTAAVLAVALVGWSDDHVPLPVLPRLMVHAGGALLVGAAAGAPWGLHDPSWWWLLLAWVPILVGFINSHNFMDGIDGILGLQGLFVMLGLGLLAAYADDAGFAALAFSSAAGCTGFLFFNLPPARIFMGDVGSGALGLAIGALSAFMVQRHPAMLWACAVLPSAFLVDSGLTLVRRVCSGQRWYTPHRQHLYQWLVRINWSHARTDSVYMIWNLVIVTPLVLLAAIRPQLGAWCLLAAYVLAAIAWQLGKHACLVRAGRRFERDFA